MKIVFRLNAARFAFGFLPLFHTACESLLLVIPWVGFQGEDTRIIEHKHFEFGTQPKTVISREYSAEWKKGDEPYYPVNDEKNGALYAQYKALADAEPGVIFGGRLGEYKYYDMDKVIEVALDVAAKELA